MNERTNERANEQYVYTVYNIYCVDVECNVWRNIRVIAALVHNGYWLGNNVNELTCTKAGSNNIVIKII